MDLETTRRDLLALRAKHGAETPIGHRCSNLIGILDSMKTATGDQRSGLAKNITDQMADLERLAQNAEHLAGHVKVTNGDR